MLRKLALVGAVFAAACSKPSSSPAPQATPPVAETAAAPKVFEAPQPKEVVSGTVLQKLESGPYTLLRLKTGSGEAWAAVPRTDRKVGDDVKVNDPLPVKGYVSKPLRRKFELVYVGNLG
jgi:hypothetical protein